jgi:ribosome biogenesis GTPase / thiamine phosphate phosphatase
MTLRELGWDAYFESCLAPAAAGDPQLRPARIGADFGEAYELLSPEGSMLGRCGGKLRRECRPVVGDWVAARLQPEQGRAEIKALLPRRSKFSRKAPGKREQEQVVGANIDTVFIMMALDANFNVRRLERYLSLAWSSGAQPVALLNKADVCPDASLFMEQARAVAGETPVIPLSALEGDNVEQLSPYLQLGKTVAVLGSSGVGKSTLVNFLLGEERQPTFETRGRDNKGYHTTTVRELIPLPSGALMLDTPGMREVGLWEAGEGLEEAFPDVVALTAQCRFSDCQHENEPGCAIRAALESAELPAERLSSYRLLAYELAARRQAVQRRRHGKPPEAPPEAPRVR